MGLLSPHRRFVDPGNMEGIPGVSPRRALPVRGEPLPGTKALRTPRDGSLRGLLGGGRTLDRPPGRAAVVMGWLAMAGSLGFLALLWIVWRNPGVADGLDRNDLLTGTVILGLGLVHVLAIMSQIVSAGRSMAGGLSIVVLYAGVLVLAVLDHLFH